MSKRMVGIARTIPEVAADRRKLLRKEDRVLLTTGGTYVADVRDPLLAGALAIHFVRSHLAHAIIEAIDTAAARAAPGVVGVFTASDLDLAALAPVLPRFPAALTAPALAQDRVRYVGEPVVAVVARRAADAADAAEQVVIDLDPLPPVAGSALAMQDTVLLFPGHGTNLAAHYEAGSAGGLLDGCDVVVEATLDLPRVAACPLEVRSAASVWDGAGRLHHWVSTQGPHAVRRALAAVFDLPEDAVRVVAPDVGGGFGPKFANYPEDIVTAWAARRLGRAVRWVETRRDSMVGLHHGRGQRQHVMLGGSAAGALRAYRLDVTQDAGAYASLGAYAPEATLRMTTGVYAIARAHAEARAYLTTTTPVSAYRGTGRPEAIDAIERAVDMFARRIGMDPVELRRRNLIGRDDLPFTTAVGTTYDSGDYAAVLKLACVHAGYDDLRAEQAARRVRGDRTVLGIGVCAYVESTAAGPDMEFASVRVDRHGAVEVRTGSSPHGQGHVTTWSQVVAGALGVDAGVVAVVHGDTDQVPAGLGTFASRSVQLAGSAIAMAAEQLVDRGRIIAAEVLEASPADIAFDRVQGRFAVAGAPARALGWVDIAAAALDEILTEHAMFRGAMTFPYGAHLAVVSVDLETGAVRLTRHVAVDDAGRLVNPLLAEGQVHGGIAQGVGEALLEEFRYDGDGTPLTTNLADYPFLSACEVPFFEVIATETAAPSNPLGAKGIGESGTIGALAAVHNAVCDALAHLGVEHVDLPLTPHRVWQAIEAARSPSVG